MKAVIILGAGFSRNSGIPVQAQIPELLIEYQPDRAFDTAVSEVLRKFMRDIFDCGYNQIYPSLDDLFNCIDISTNSGHRLGIDYSPFHLRGIRRMLVYRVFQILNNMYGENPEVTKLVETLAGGFSRIDFVVLNWDDILERYILKTLPGACIDYKNDAIALRGRESGKGRKIGVYKIHGSCNWLYCDNCRSLFYDIHGEVPLVKKAGFQELDFSLFPQIREWESLAGYKEKCEKCGNVISSHIATFSYRKSFRANSFANIWRNAEEVLSDAEKWIFIGYSLPEADYEFKHLLKISQLKYRHTEKPAQTVDVVLLNSKETLGKYRGFFGDCLEYMGNAGIEDYIRHLHNRI